MFHRDVPMHIDGNDRLPLLEVSGVVGMVGEHSKPASQQHFEVEMLRYSLNPRRVEPHHLVTADLRGRMRADTLADIEGIVVREKGQASRVVITLDPLIQSIAIEVHGEDVEFVDTSVPPTLKKIDEEIEQSAGTPLYQSSCLDSYPRPIQVVSPVACTH